MSKSREKGVHPGWAVKTKDGEWLTSGHGWHLFEGAGYAVCFDSEKEAKAAAEDCRQDFVDGDKLEFEIVVAWEPLCESLRSEVASLRKANSLSPSEIWDMTEELETILSRLKEVR